MLKLNSISQNVFDGKSIALKLNSTGEKSVQVGNAKLTRGDIVALGRLVTCEYIGSRLNKRQKALNGDMYKSRIPATTDYGTLSKLHQDAKFAFCAVKAYESIGQNVPATLAEMKQDRSLYTNQTFIATLASIDSAVIQPLFFRVIDDVSMGGLMNWSDVEMGQTKQIDIKSNDVFMYQDASHGSQWSSPYNYMYGKTITLTPKPRTCNVKILWYRDVVNGESGEYYAAIIRGLYADIYARFTSTLLAIAGNSKYVPAGLQATSYTTKNFLTISTNVAAANGLDREDLVAFGTAVALNSVIPQDSQGAILGMQYGLGEEWFGTGYLPKAGKVDLLEVRPAIVPHTQNRDMVHLFPDNKIFIAAKAAGNYAPIQGVYAKGTPLNIVLTPERGSADMSIDMAVEIMYDVAEVVASKIGVITLA